MNAIRVKAHIDSETLRLPELKPLIGKDVEIIVLEESRKRTKAAKKDTKPKKGWFTRNFGAGRDMDFEGFEEAREKWRQEELDTQREPPE
jgi:hypothetical protein